MSMNGGLAGDKGVTMTSASRADIDWHLFDRVVSLLTVWHLSWFYGGSLGPTD
jgi:hypothetical protein